MNPMNPKIILVTGSFPPDVCGIGDYTHSLALALERAGMKAEVLCHRSWNVSGTIQAIRRLLAEKHSLVHIQYPTMGYGFSLGPQFCALAKHSVITLHEFSFAHPLRKLSLLPFTMHSRHLVMTSEFEKQSLIAKMPWAARRIRVIPIGSNIPPSRFLAGEARKQIAYFGLVMPRKGLEDFIAFSELVRAAELEWDLLIIGKIPPRHAAYAKGLMNSANSQVNWLLDRSPEEISDVLCRTSLGYFPFPDGASERRGSLKAAMAAGLPCITTCTEQTPMALADAMAFASTPHEAFDLALRLMDAPAERNRLSQSALTYSQSFSWEKIAQAHIELYRELNPSMG